jgi:hypothetical protein
VPDDRSCPDPDGLRSVRLGVARDYFGAHEGTDAVMEHAIAQLEAAGHLSKRESQRDAKSQVDACEAEVRGRGVTEQLLTWYRDDVEPSLLSYAVHPCARGEHLPRHAVYRPRVGPLSAVRFFYKALLWICLVGIPALQCCRRRNSRGQ